MSSDVVAILEACYATDVADDQRWLEAVTEVAVPLLRSSRGVVSWLYSTDGASILPSTIVLHGDVGPATEEFLRGVIGALPADMVRTFCALPCLLGRDAPIPDHDLVWSQLERFGIGDVLVINGRDPTGHGCYLGATRPTATRLTQRTQRTWAQVASHLASGYRLRRRLRAAATTNEDLTEAIVTPDGKLAHAEASAQSPSALLALQRAARAVDTARGSLRRRDPDAAVDEWRGLIAARWTLVEHFESDGKRFLLAKRNDPPIATVHNLTPRELQAVGFASLGHNNKLIAYEMGISTSTVGVLLSRAAKRVGATSRQALIAAYVRAHDEETEH